MSRADVLKSAMQLFWLQGADQSSYAEIVRATGASRKALYGWWPDKSEMVRQSLELYQEQVLSQVLAPLTSDPKGDLELFWSQIQAVVSSGSWRGCYLCRTASGPLSSDPAVSGMFRAHVERLQGAVANAVAKAKQHGFVDTAIDPETAGRSSAAFIVLLSALAAAGAPAEDLAILVTDARRACGVGYPFI
jgi:AcrR family transcriptional regulator